MAARNGWGRSNSIPVEVVVCSWSWVTVTRSKTQNHGLHLGVSPDRGTPSSVVLVWRIPFHLQTRGRCTHPASATSTAPFRHRKSLCFTQGSCPVCGTKGGSPWGDPSVKGVALGGPSAPHNLGTWGCCSVSARKLSERTLQTALARTCRY